MQSIINKCSELPSKDWKLYEKTRRFLLDSDLSNYKSLSTYSGKSPKGGTAILFFDEQGYELTQSRVTGFLPAGAFATHVNAIFSDK